MAGTQTKPAMRGRDVVALGFAIMVIATVLFVVDKVEDAASNGDSGPGSNSDDNNDDRRLIELVVLWQDREKFGPVIEDDWDPDFGDQRTRLVDPKRQVVIRYWIDGEETRLPPTKQGRWNEFFALRVGTEVRLRVEEISANGHLAGFKMGVIYENERQENAEFRNDGEAIDITHVVGDVRP